jgi:hypothetical protein
MRPMRGRALFAGALVACVAACQLVLGIDPDGIVLPPGDAPPHDAAIDRGGSIIDAAGGRDTETPDVFASDGPTPDADAGRRCDPTTPFTSFAPVAELASVDYESGFRLSPDGLEAFFSRAPRYPDASGGVGLVGNDLYSAKRVDASAAFTSITRLEPPSLVDAYTPDLNATVSADGRTMYFDSYRPFRRVWKSTRAAPSSPWSDATQVALFDDGWEEYDPFLVPDGSALYFTTATDLPGYERAGHVWRAPITNDTIGMPVVMADLLNGTDHGQRAAVVTPDELVIFWADSGENPPTRMWTASRSSKMAAFTNKRQLSELNGTYLDLPSWVSPDACTLYFASQRAGPNVLDIYVARR